MLVQFLIDNPRSWLMDYVEDFVAQVKKLGHDSFIVHRHEEVKKGDVLVMIACEKKFTNLPLNKFNLVVHESDLPKGKGWSPLTWQILEGKNKIPVTLFEAAENIDAGPIYAQKTIEFAGHELIDELRQQQAAATIELVLQFLRSLPKVNPRPQQGAETVYPRRTPRDSELDVNKTIAEQFNNLRVADNERYPAFFVYQGHKYILSVRKDTGGQNS